MNNYAYITLATNETYLIYAAYLQASLKINNSQYPLIIMITEDLQDNKYLKYFNNVITIPHLQFSYRIHIDRYVNTINKFYMFNLIEYDKLIFLDADMVLFTNIDKLFTLEPKFICSTYVPLRYCTKSNTLYPLNNLMVITPDEKIYREVVNASQNNELLTDDESVIYHLLYSDNFQNEKWNNDCNIFENLNIQFNDYPVYIHAKKWQFDFYKHNITPENIENNIKTGKQFMECLYNYYQKVISEATGLFTPRQPIISYFTTRGQLKHFNSAD